jgi:hypothetical protein
MKKKEKYVWVVLQDVDCELTDCLHGIFEKKTSAVAFVKELLGKWLDKYAIKGSLEDDEAVMFQQYEYEGYSIVKMLVQ